MQLNYCMGCFAPAEPDGICPHCGFDKSRYEPKPHHLPPETILHGRYLVGKVLGEGGFGITYIGMDLALERKVAIKEFFPGGNVWRDLHQGLSVTCYSAQSFTTVFETGKQNCMKEAKSLAQLDDIEAVVRVLDHFLENNTAYVIMEYVDGMTLKQYVRTLSQRMTFPQAFEMLLPVMYALDAVHQRGFIHRDISPDNIMILPNGKAKLLDFGAVKSVNRGGSSTENPVIKRGFSPLEQYSTEGQLGAWTDVYSICATFFYLLTGTTVAEPMDRLSADDQTQALLREAVPENVLPILLQGLAIRAEERTQSMGELIERLEETQPKPAAVPAWMRHLKWILPLTAVVMIALVVVLVQAFTSPAAKKYTYGRDPANMMSDSVSVVVSTQTGYISDFCDASNGRLFRIDCSDDGSYSFTDIAPYAFCLNYLNDTLYFVSKDDHSIYRLASGETEPTMLYAASAIGQLIAVDTGSHTYLYFTESSGSLIYLRRLEVDTKDAETISSGQDAILYAIHDNTIYYTNAKKQLWTLSMEGGEEICLVDDLTVNAFCFSDKYLYLQTDDAVIEATPKGKQIRTLENVKPGFSLTSPTGGSYICPILARDGKLIFADSETMYLKSCDLENGSIADLIDAVCYNYEIYLDGFLYTTMYTDTPTLNYMNNGQDASDTDNNAFPIWAYSQTETLVRTQPDNAVNGSFGRMTSEYAYFISKGALYGIDLSTNSTKRITNQSGTCSDLNVLPDGTLYAVSQVNGTCKIDSTKAGNIYTGTDLRDLQYYRKDGYEKLIFTDLDKNGDRYAYSVGMDGKLLTRLSHVPCAQGSLAVQGSLMIYTDTERKHLYSASIAGQGAFEVYAAVDDGSVICQAIPGDENGFYLSVRGSKGEMHFLTVDYTGSVVRDKQVNIKQFGFAGGTLYAVDPTDGALYRYTDPLGDLTQRTQVYKKNVEAINIAEVSGEYAIFFRTKDGNVYCTSADTETPIDLTARTKSVS